MIKPTTMEELNWYNRGYNNGIAAFQDAYTSIEKQQNKFRGLTKTQIFLLYENVEKDAIKSGDSINWTFYKRIEEALLEINRHLKLEAKVIYDNAE
jgi:hypothetical protein